MKIPVPRLGICIGLVGLVIASANAFFAFNKYQVSPFSTEFYSDVFGALFSGTIGLTTLFYCLRTGYSFRVWGESRSFTLELAEGQSFQIGPLLGLAGKSICLDIKNDLPAEFKGKVKSFFVYRRLPPDPVVQYELKLISAEGNFSEVIAKEEFGVRVYSSHSDRSDGDASSIWEGPVNSSGRCLYLQIKLVNIVLSQGEKIQKREGMKAKVSGNVSVAVKLKDVLKLQGISIRQSRVVGMLEDSVFSSDFCR